MEMIVPTERRGIVMTSGAPEGQPENSPGQGLEAAVLGFPDPTKTNPLFFWLGFPALEAENQTKKEGKYNTGMQPRTALPPTRCSGAASRLSWATIASPLRDFGLARSARGLASPTSNHAPATLVAGLRQRGC